MIHKLEIKKPFADAIHDGRKRFEVRRNDRGFNSGDTVVFCVVDDSGIRDLFHPIHDTSWTITYVLSGWGIEEGYVVFGIEREDGAE